MEITKLSSFNDNSTHLFYDEDSSCVIRRLNKSKIEVIKIGSFGTMLEFDCENASSLKLCRVSPDIKVIATIRSLLQVEYISISGSSMHSSSLKSSGTMNQLLGIHWISKEILLYVSKLGIEILKYSASGSRVSIKLLKSYSLYVNWYRYLSSHHLFLCSSGSNGSTFHVFQANHGCFTRWPKKSFEIGFGMKCAYEDVMLFSMNNVPHLAMFRPSPSAPSMSVTFYSLVNSQIRRKFEMEIDIFSAVELNVVENFIAMHLKNTRKTIMVDMRNPFAETKRLPRFKPIDMGIFMPEGSNTNFYDFHSYSDEILVDEHYGDIYRLDLAITNLLESFIGSSGERAFVLTGQRFKSEEFFENFLESISQKESLFIISAILRQIFPPRDVPLELSEQPVAAAVSAIPALYLPHDNLTLDFRPKYSAIEIYEKVLQPFLQKKDVSSVYKSGVLLELVYALLLAGKKSPTFLSELIVNHMVLSEKHDQLLYLLENRIISDSIKIAQMILHTNGSHEQRYIQMGLDMLKRMNRMDMIVDILLERGEVIRAINFVKDHGLLKSISPRQFLYYAKLHGRTLTFYNTFRFLQQRNLYLYNTESFREMDNCSEFVEYFDQLFNAE